MNDPTGAEVPDDAPPAPEAASSGDGGSSTVLGGAHDARGPNARWLTVARARAVLRPPAERLDDAPPGSRPQAHIPDAD